MTRPLRVAIVYDRVFPASYGGVERWFRLLAESLAAEGHSVTYLTTQHWPHQSPPLMCGVRIVPLVNVTEIYSGGRRSLRPVLTFGAAVARYMLQHTRSFDVVHSTAVSPAAARAVVSLAREIGYLPVLDWWEVWTAFGWQNYLGALRGSIATRLERTLAHSSHLPVTYSNLHTRRLNSLRGKDDALRLRGVLPAVELASQPCKPKPYVLLANRLIPEKQTTAILPALLLARRTHPSLRVVIVGSGPIEPELRARVAELGLSESVSMLNEVGDEELEHLMREALCLALLSRREGYGLAVAEAMQFGTPALVLEHADSAASERIEAGENGVLVPSLEPEQLASAILDLHAAGMPFRDRTLAWRKRHDGVLTIEHSLPYLISRYHEGATARSTGRWRNARP